MSSSTGRTYEDALTCPVLKILNSAPGGKMTTSELKAAVKVQVTTLTSGDLAPSKTRNDKMIDQIVGNIVSHRADDGNMVKEGLLQYTASPGGTGSLQITSKGIKYLEDSCP